MRAREVTQLCTCIAALLGCADGGAVSHADVASPCKPFEARACPCVGGGMGTQTCSRSGHAFGACRGCATDDPDGGASLATLDDGSAFDPRVPLPGSVCGVGLPVLCEPQRQKCCARSLSVDTCIADGRAVHVRVCGVRRGRGALRRSRGLRRRRGLLRHARISRTAVPRTTRNFWCAAQCTKQQNLACHEHGQLCPSGLLCADSQLIPNVQVCIDPASLDQ